MQPQSPEGAVRAQAKRRLVDLLKAAVGGVVVAAATLVTPAAEASPVDAVARQAALTDRVQELRQQLADRGELTDPTELTLASFNNWGNHFHNWNNWNNWHNWHNYH